MKSCYFRSASVRSAALFVGLSGFLQAGISVHGSSTNYEETGGNWLSMGANDIDESGGLGTDGWLFFGNFNNAQQNNQPFSLHVQMVVCFSTDLINWEPADVSALVSRTNHGDGTATLSFRSPDLISSESKQFGVVHLELR